MKKATSSPMFPNYAAGHTRAKSLDVLIKHVAGAITLCLAD